MDSSNLHLFQDNLGKRASQRSSQSGFGSAYVDDDVVFSHNGAYRDSTFRSWFNLIRQRAPAMYVHCEEETVDCCIHCCCCCCYFCK